MIYLDIFRHAVLIFSVGEVAMKDQEEDLSSKPRKLATSMTSYNAVITDGEWEKFFQKLSTGMSISRTHKFI